MNLGRYTFGDQRDIDAFLSRLEGELTSLRAILAGRVSEITFLSTGSSSTVGALATTVASFDVTLNASQLVEASCIGRTSAGNTTVHRKVAAVKDVAGTVTIVGSVINDVDVSDAALAGVAVTLDVSGTTLRLRATGVAAQTITWVGDISVKVNQ